MQGPHNRAVACPLCHEKFFPKSLPFHQKQCQKRQAARRVNCPYCNVEVSQLELPAHIGQCPRARKPPRGGGGGQGGGRQGASPAPGGHGGGRGGAGHGGRQEEEDERSLGPGQYDPEVLEDGRMRCIYCGRYFGADRIDKHQSICGKLQNARPKGLNGETTQTGAKIFDATAQRLGMGNAFCSPEQYKRRQEERQRSLAKSKAKTQTNWRRQHAEFQAACKAGRGDEVAAATLPPRTGAVTCPHCARQFDRVAAERHIPICAKVINRPKPPPTPARQPPTPPSQGSWQGSTLRPPTSGHLGVQDDPYEYADSMRSGQWPPRASGSPQRTPGRNGGARGAAAAAGPPGGLRRPSASEGALPRIPGRRGLAASAESFRPRQGGAEGPEARVAGRRQLAATADAFRQAAEAGGGRRQPESPEPGSAGLRRAAEAGGGRRPPESPKPGSAGSSSRASSGTGLNAARSLRQQRPPGSESPAAERPATVEELPSMDDSDSDATWRPDLDLTNKPLATTTKGQDSDWRLGRSPRSGEEDSRPAAATQRMGLRRSALLYRLLSQVPAEALQRELGSCGVDGEGLDQEALIEALAEQLS